jgi:MFS family permease
LAAFDPLPARAWLTVGLLWAAACLNYVDRLMITTMRGSVMEVIPMTEAQFGLLTSVFLVVYAVLSPFAGFLADRFSRSRVIIGSVLAWSVVTMLTAYARTYEQLLATRALMGLTQAACMPASAALIVEYHRGATRSLASGLLLGGAVTGGALGGLGGWLAERHGWIYAYQLFGAIGIGLGLLLMFLLRDPPAAEPSPASDGGRSSIRMGEALAALFTSRAYLVMLTYGCVVGVVSWSVVGWMPTYMKEQFHLTQGAAGLYTLAYLNIAALFGMLVGGAWADRWSRTNGQARILVAATGVAVAALGVLLLAHTALFAVALAGLALYGFTRYFADTNTMPILCRFVETRYRATCWGISTFFGCVVGGAGIYAGGVLRDAHVDTSRVFMLAAVCLAAGALLLYSLRFCPPLPAARPGEE